MKSRGDLRCSSTSIRSSSDGWESKHVNMMTFAAQARLPCNLAQSKPDGKHINQWEAAAFRHIPPSGGVITSSEENQRAAEANSPIKEPDWSPASAVAAVMPPDAHLGAHVHVFPRPRPSLNSCPLPFPLSAEWLDVRLWFSRCPDGLSAGWRMVAATASTRCKWLSPSCSRWLVTFRVVTWRRVTLSRLFWSRVVCLSLREMGAMAPPKLKFHPLFGISFDKLQLFGNRRPAAWLRGAVFCYSGSQNCSFKTFWVWKRMVNTPIGFSYLLFHSPHPKIRLRIVAINGIDNGVAVAKL